MGKNCCDKFQKTPTSMQLLKRIPPWVFSWDYYKIIQDNNFLYVRVHIKMIPRKFWILNPKSF